MYFQGSISKIHDLIIYYFYRTYSKSFLFAVIHTYYIYETTHKISESVVENKFIVQNILKVYRGKQIIDLEF